MRGDRAQRGGGGAAPDGAGAVRSCRGTKPGGIANPLGSGVGCTNTGGAIVGIGGGAAEADGAADDGADGSEVGIGIVIGIWPGIPRNPGGSCGTLNDEDGACSALDGDGGGVA